MLNFIAQQTGHGVSAETIGIIIGSIILSVTGGGTAGAMIYRRSTQKTGAATSDRDVCPIHDQFAQLLEERKAHSDNEVTEIKQAVNNLQAAVHKGFDRMEAKIDQLYGRIQ